MKCKVTVCTEQVLAITSKLVDFNGDLAAWKDAIYQLFRYDMTYSFAHRIMVKENRAGVYVSIIAKPETEEDIKSVMEEVGFRNLRISHDSIGVIDGSELPDNMMIDYVEVDY